MGISSSIRRKLPVILRNKKLIMSCFIGVILIAALFAILLGNGRQESYKEVTGTSLQGTIAYEEPCNKGHCDKTRAFDFNIYVLKEDGQQVGVIRPDNNGKFNLALREGEYTLLIGKKFGHGKSFPQEQITLKKDRALVLSLRYR